MLTTRDELHDIVDSLPSDQLDAAKRALEQIARNECALSLEDVLATRPLDDEGLTPEGEGAIEVGFADLAAGRVVPQDEMDREFGR